MRRRRQDPPAEPKGAPRTPAPAKPAEPPTPRRAVRLLPAEPDHLSDDDRRFATALLEHSPIIAIAVDLIRRFAIMVKERVAGALDGWLREAEASALASFAAGLRRDEDAVRAALTEPWSNGQVEGQVNRLKVIKREMYGRAGFDLLRCRVLAHASQREDEEIKHAKIIHTKLGRTQNWTPITPQWGSVFHAE
jgi:transposase